PRGGDGGGAPGRRGGARRVHRARRRRRTRPGVVADRPHQLAPLPRRRDGEGVHPCAGGLAEGGRPARAGLDPPDARARLLPRADARRRRDRSLRGDPPARRPARRRRGLDAREDRRARGDAGPLRRRAAPVPAVPEARRGVRVGAGPRGADQLLGPDRAARWRSGGRRARAAIRLRGARAPRRDVDPVDEPGAAGTGARGAGAARRGGAVHAPERGNGGERRPRLADDVAWRARTRACASRPDRRGGTARTRGGGDRGANGLPRLARRGAPRPRRGAAPRRRPRRLGGSRRGGTRALRGEGPPRPRGADVLAARAAGRAAPGLTELEAGASLAPPTGGAPMEDQRPESPDAEPEEEVATIEPPPSPDREERESIDTIEPPPSPEREEYESTHTIEPPR